jgi:hypothetical protein
MNSSSNAKVCELQHIHGLLDDVLKVKSNAIVKSTD